MSRALILAFCLLSPYFSGAQEPLTLSGLLEYKQERLDVLYKGSLPGPVPDGRGRGKALFFPGSILTHPKAAVASLVWQGKVFDLKDGTLVNKILGFKLIKAKVFPGLSWFDGKPAIILDYQDTAIPPFSGIRDEIRLVAPGLYLGRAYLRTGKDTNAFVLSFALQFDVPGGAVGKEQPSQEPLPARVPTPLSDRLDAMEAKLSPALEQAQGGGPEVSAEAGRQVQAVLSGSGELAFSGDAGLQDAVAADGTYVEPRYRILPVGKLPRQDGAVPAPGESRASTFAEVWTALRKDPLSPPFPTAKVSFWKFFKGFKFALFSSAKRTLSDERDLLPDFDKLIRPNGVALAGEWEITEESPYTGYFSKGSKAPVVARASSFSDDVHSGGHRSFGMALKLFPEADPGSEQQPKTANIFLIDDNGGKKTAHYTDAELVTDPKLSLRWGLVWRAPILAAVSLAQGLADKHPGYRQLYPVSRLGLAAQDEARTPRRLMLKGAPGTARVDASDFREELDAARYRGGLVFDVFVSEDEKADWVKLGRVRFDDSVVSRAVDHNLHFSHPRFQK